MGQESISKVYTMSEIFNIVRKQPKEQLLKLKKF